MFSILNIYSALEIIYKITYSLSQEKRSQRFTSAMSSSRRMEPKLGSMKANQKVSRLDALSSPR